MRIHACIKHYTSMSTFINKDFHTAGGPSTSGVVPHTLDSVTFENTNNVPLQTPHHHLTEIFLDLDPTSSDEDADFPPMTNHIFLPNQHGAGNLNGEENIDDIYPFAWALDGRRFGEGGNRSTHPNSSHDYSIVCLNGVHVTYDV